MGQDQGGPAARFDGLCHRECLARSGNSKQNLMLFPVVDAADQRFDRALLIASGPVRHPDLK
jgi:hypothetical protein